MRILAVLCARNEEPYIATALANLIAEGLDVVLIDHESTDRTVSLAQPFLGHGLRGIERLRWKGRFSLSEQLEAKARIIAQADDDWVVHVDADEWLTAPDERRTLAEALSAADASGANCVNFDQFVFVPRPGEDVSGDFVTRSTRYYFFAPAHPFTIRAWKRNAGLDNRRHAGHLLTGASRLYERDFPLRHYIFLSEEHARRKYLERRFDEDELRKGWHGDKARATAEGLRFPADDHMRTLSHSSSKAFDRSRPVTKHYWEWDSSESPPSGGT